MDDRTSLIEAQTREIIPQIPKALSDIFRGKDQVACYYALSFALATLGETLRIDDETQVLALKANLERGEVYWNS